MIMSTRKDAVSTGKVILNSNANWNKDLAPRAVGYVGLYSRQRTGHASMPSNAKFCYEESYQHSQSSVQGSPEIMCRICASIPLLIYGTSFPLMPRLINNYSQNFNRAHARWGVEEMRNG
jgi:hypothetical protein